MNEEYKQLNAIENFKNEYYVVNCKTKEEIRQFINIYIDNICIDNICMDDENINIINNAYHIFKEKTCFCYNKKDEIIMYNNINYYKLINMQILEFKYFMEYYNKDNEVEQLDNVGFIGVKYLDKTMDKLEKTDNGDCIDLRVREITLYKNMANDNINSVYDSETLKKHYLSYQAGDVLFIKFGVILKVPYDKRINLYSRSSTFKKYGLILTNSIGIIDNSYCGNEDEICGMFYALNKGKISFNERIAQFEVVDRMICTNREIVELTNIENPSRGGYGTSGVN